MSQLTVYQLKIVLMGSSPSIWRRIEVFADTLLPDLHKIIQSTMGWYNTHLHQFIHNKEFYMARDHSMEIPAKDYNKVKCSDLLKNVGDKILYEYDFGDGWLREIKLEKISTMGERHCPFCTDGENACPAEDCGGIPGYAHLTEVLTDPNHEDHERMKDWLGVDNFDPKSFDVDFVNKRLECKDFGCLMQ